MTSWVKVASHGDSPESVRKRLVDNLEDALEKLTEDMLADPSIPTELIGRAVAKTRALYMKRIEHDLPLMMESMRLTAAADDVAPLHS